MVRLVLLLSNYKSKVPTMQVDSLNCARINFLVPGNRPSKTSTNDLNCPTNIDPDCIWLEFVQKVVEMFTTPPLLKLKKGH